MGAPLPVHRQAFSSWMEGLVGGHTSYNIFVATLRSHQATASISFPTHLQLDSAT